MRFALLGDHPDGLDMAQALAGTGRHELAVYSGPAVGAEILARKGQRPARVGDLEEVLADPGVELLIVAGTPASRAALLRRALQSERHVLCVHPADDSPDIAYEASMLQVDTGMLLLPLMPEALHPAFQRLAAVAGIKSHTPVDAITPASGHSTGPAPGAPLLKCERWSTDAILLDADAGGKHKPSVPGWDALRLVAGEIVELQVFSGPEVLDPKEPLLISGRFAGGGLLQATYLPNQAEARWRLILTAAGHGELLFPEGWPGPARLTYIDEAGQERVEEWPPFHPWAAMTEAFEEALKRLPARSLRKGRVPGTMADDSLARGRLGWLDEVRALELDDAARRSVARRRASTLDFQEISEEAGFKGTMTLVGCSLLWISLMLLILSVWVPWLGWFIAPVFGIFLVMQFLRWLMPQA